jgi:acyl-CoA thioesterase FadM
MTDWTETYRGAVPPWQCDVTEHFTVAYYFDRLEEAEANLADELGLGTLPRRDDLPRASTPASRANCAPARASTSRARRSASIMGCGSAIASSTRPTARSSPGSTTPNPAPSLPRPTASSRPRAGRVKPGDVDAAGHFALGAMVHRFSNSSAQFGAAIGMDAAFMQQQRRGFSTFELILRLSGALPLDAPYLVQIGISTSAVHRCA